jgi:hypothetical protein
MRKIAQIFVCFSEGPNFKGVFMEHDLIYMSDAILQLLKVAIHT